MTLFQVATIVSGIFAGLSVLGLPLWIMGVPGVDNNYAKDWKMGLDVLLVFPVVWLFNYAPYFSMRGSVSDETRASWQFYSSLIALGALAVAILRLVQAFKTMR